MPADAQTQRAEIGQVPSHWEVAPLSAFVSRVTYGFTNPMPTVDDGPFMVTAKDIHDGRIDYSTARHTDWKAYRNDLTDKSRPRINDVLLTKDGSIGRVAICDRADVCINQSVALIQPNGNINSRFLLYLLQTPHYQRRMEEDSDGTTIKHIYITRVDKMEVAIPPLAEQDAIIGVVGALDEKIELNRRMNETLEAMARTLFKSWFIDFDPTRAKAEGRDPGLPKPIADLFPARLVDSELGEIPEGWEVGCVDDEFDLVMGQSPPGDTYNEAGEGSPFYQGRADFGFRYPTRRVFCTSPTRFAKAGDTLISVRAPVGDINMAAEDCAIGRGVAAARHKTGSRSYSYQFMGSLDEVFARFEAEGTVFGSINKGDFHSIPTIKPPRPIISQFEKAICPIDSRIEVNERESGILSSLRDTLLPKLISGELRVGRTGFVNGETG
jgi:type I restriction enzyme, S subunit